MSLLRALDRDDNSEARGFYLTGWNGSESYVFDRIGRGTNLFVPSVTLSLLGSTQPSLLQNYVRGVIDGTSMDDGLLQRFSMTVWPDMSSHWEEHDRAPNPDYRRRAIEMFGRLDRMTAQHVGAIDDSLERSNPYLRFDDAGCLVFKEWRRALEARLRSDEVHPALERHLAKYRKLVPAIALIHHLASGNTGPVSGVSVVAALGWAEYLESHAQRIYSAGAAGAVEGAKVILRHLRKDRLGPTFSARDIQRRNWSQIGQDGKRVEASLELLVEFGWLDVKEVPPGPSGGRRTYLYTINPKGSAG